MLSRRLRFQLIIAVVMLCLTVAMIAALIAYTVYQEVKFGQDVNLETAGDVDAGR